MLRMRMILGLCLCGLLVPGYVAAQQITAAASWTDNSANEDGFRLERKTGVGGTYATVATVGVDVTDAVDPGPLVQGTDYCWHVVAFNVGGESASNEVCQTVPVIAPNAPSVLTIQIVAPPGASPQPAVLSSTPESTPQPAPVQPPPPGS